MTRRFTPVLFIVLCNVTAFTAVLFFHLAADTPIHFINRWIMPGVDYLDFYQASLRVLQGESPYVVARFVTPPLFAFVNLPLSVLDYFWKDALTPPRRFSLVITALGVALTQWQAVALHAVTGNIAAYYIPGIGLLLTMTGISLHALIQWRGR